MEIVTAETQSAQRAKANASSSLRSLRLCGESNFILAESLNVLRRQHPLSARPCTLHPTCRRRRPSRPQAGSYVGRTRRLVGARLRATRRLHDTNPPRGNVQMPGPVCGDTSGTKAISFRQSPKPAPLIWRGESTNNLRLGSPKNYAAALGTGCCEWRMSDAAMTWNLELLAGFAPNWVNPSPPN
jgi:hypothetical protein